MAYTNIDDPSEYFTTTLWTGSGSSPRTITNDANSGNFQPDFVWTKGRNEAYEHQLYDSSRGTGESKGLTANDGSAEGYVGRYGYLSSFDSNGFTGTAGSASSIAYFNSSAKTYAAWQWKANGGTTSTNTNGTITSTVQANTDAGFSIVTYTGNGGTNQTVGHGLGVAPQVIIVKNREVSANWIVYHHKIGTSKYLFLDTTGGAADSSNIWGSSAPSSTTFTVQQHNEYNDSGEGLVAYCFAEKQGYSKFGSYVGNGNANGSFVYTGFKPAFVMIKANSAFKNWYIWDNKRSPINPVDEGLVPNLAGAEVTGYDPIDILSNGFKLRDADATWNGSGTTILYMAFAENPFTTSTGIPTTAR
jgi:hypothetical protein